MWINIVIVLSFTPYFCTGSGWFPHYIVMGWLIPSFQGFCILHYKQANFIQLTHVAVFRLLAINFHAALYPPFHPLVSWSSGKVFFSTEFLTMIMDRVGSAIEHKAEAR